MTRTGALALAVSITLGFGSILGMAGADTKGVTDPAGDSVAAGFDIVKATAGHKGKRKLVHTVKMDGTLPAELGDFQVSVQFNLDGDRDCEREFNASALGTTPLIKCGVGEGSKSAKVTKPSPKTLKFTFKRAGIIGNKDRYKWRVRTRECPGGPPCATEADSAPNDAPGGVRYVTHKLKD